MSGETAETSGHDDHHHDHCQCDHNITTKSTSDFN
jgi:hypothetical protein